MFVDDADVDPFPDLVFSKASKTFEAYVVDKSNPAVIALHDAAEEICKGSDRPGRKRKKPANADLIASNAIVTALALSLSPCRTCPTYSA